MFLLFMFTWVQGIANFGFIIELDRTEYTSCIAEDKDYLTGLNPKYYGWFQERFGRQSEPYFTSEPECRQLCPNGKARPRQCIKRCNRAIKRRKVRYRQAIRFHRRNGYHAAGHDLVDDIDDILLSCYN